MKQEDIAPIAQLRNFPRCHCSVHAQQVNFTVGRLCLNKTAHRKKNEKRPRNSYQQVGLRRVGTCHGSSASRQFTKGRGGLVWQDSGHITFPFLLTQLPLPELRVGESMLQLLWVLELLGNKIGC